MLQEQRAEAEELFEARAARLERLAEEWKSKYEALRRRFALETEGFRRDAHEIGRCDAEGTGGRRMGGGGAGHFASEVSVYIFFFLCFCSVGLFMESLIVATYCRHRYPVSQV